MSWNLIILDNQARVVKAAVPTIQLSNHVKHKWRKIE